MLPESSLERESPAAVVAIGTSSKEKGGEVQPVGGKVQDKILLLEFGDTRGVLEDPGYVLEMVTF